jgi:hypothetical protein
MAMTQQKIPRQGVVVYIINGIKELVKTTNIYILVYSAVAVPIIIMLGWVFVAERIFDGSIPEKYTSIILAFCMFISSFGGLIQIVRKEAPGLLGIPFRGILPVLSGVLWVTVCWLFGFLSIYFAFFSQ